MANSVTKSTFKDLCSYFQSDGDNISRMVDAAFASLTPAEKAADNLLVYTFPLISNTKQEIDDDAGARPLLIVGRSNGTACWIHFHNVDADSVTLGTTEIDLTLPLAGTANEFSYMLIGGLSFKRMWVTGLTVSGSTTVEGAAAPTNPPDVWVIYTGS